MPSFPWLPVHTLIRDSVYCGRVLDEGEDYQILDSKDGSKIILLIKNSAPWINKKSSGKTQCETLLLMGLIKEFSFDDQSYWVAIFNKESCPRAVSKLIGPVGTSAPDLASLANAVSEMTDLYPDCVWDSALYIKSEKICLATEFDRSKSVLSYRQRLAMRLLAGAILDTNLSTDVIQKFNPQLTTAQIRDFLSALEIENQTVGKILDHCQVSNPSHFSLPGRPELEQFFREHVIDYFYRYNEYQRMGINPPNGILLYGPPGTGKTYSTKILANFLGWKVFDIDIGSVGSPYIHQTSKILKEIFEKAAQNAPSIVLMEEIDALAGSRSGQMHDYKIEEISQLLRLIETASKQGILVIGTTNRFHSMDDAIVRRGRFDHIIELGFPSQEEILSAIEGMLKRKPVANDVNFNIFAEQLTGYPMSDIAWAVNEAARIAVKNNKEEIDQECLLRAANAVSKSAKRGNSAHRGHE